jgi:hypothetical protein
LHAGSERTGDVFLHPCQGIDFGIMPSTSSTIAWSDPSLAQTTKDILRHLKVLVAEGFEALLPYAASGDALAELTKRERSKANRIHAALKRDRNYYR